MTASEYIKSKGLPSLAYVARKVNKTEATLFNWYRDNFDLFKYTVNGVLGEYQAEETNIKQSCERARK